MPRCLQRQNCILLVYNVPPVLSVFATAQGELRRYRVLWGHTGVYRALWRIKQHTYTLIAPVFWDYIDPPGKILISAIHKAPRCEAMELPRGTLLLREVCFVLPRDNRGSAWRCSGASRFLVIKMACISTYISV